MGPLIRREYFLLLFPCSEFPRNTLKRKSSTWKILDLSSFEISSPPPPSRDLAQNLTVLENVARETRQNEKFEWMLYHIPSEAVKDTKILRAKPRLHNIAY